MLTGQLLGPGDTGPEVLKLQSRLFSAMTGRWDDELTARVRGYQFAHGLDQTGVIDTPTATSLEKRR